MASRTSRLLREGTTAPPRGRGALRRRAADRPSEHRWHSPSRNRRSLPRDGARRDRPASRCTRGRSSRPLTGACSTWLRRDRAERSIVVLDCPDELLVAPDGDLRMLLARTPARSPANYLCCNCRRSCSPNCRTSERATLSMQARRYFAPLKTGVTTLTSGDVSGGEEPPVSEELMTSVSDRRSYVAALDRSRRSTSRRAGSPSLSTRGRPRGGRVVPSPLAVATAGRGVSETTVVMRQRSVAFFERRDHTRELVRPALLGRRRRCHSGLHVPSSPVPSRSGAPSTRRATLEGDSRARCVRVVRGDARPRD